MEAAGTATCQDCGRKLTAAASVKARRGPGCRAKIRRTGRDLAALPGIAKPEQMARATELIEDDGIVRTSRPGVFAATSTDGTTIYIVDVPAGTCGCKAGQYGRYCYHLLAAQILSIASLRRVAA